jgi:hypothetical protein
MLAHCLRKNEQRRRSPLFETTSTLDRNLGSKVEPKAETQNQLFLHWNASIRCMVCVWTTPKLISMPNPAHTDAFVSSSQAARMRQDATPLTGCVSSAINMTLYVATLTPAAPRPRHTENATPGCRFSLLDGAQHVRVCRRSEHHQTSVPIERHSAKRKRKVKTQLKLLQRSLSICASFCSRQ